MEEHQSQHVEENPERMERANELNEVLETLTSEDVKKTLANFTGFERRTLKPHHDFLARQVERRQAVIPEPQEASIEGTSDTNELKLDILRLLGEKHLSERELVQAIVKERGESDPRSAQAERTIRARVHGALQNPALLSSLYVDSQERFFVKPIGGGAVNDEPGTNYPAPENHKASNNEDVKKVSIIDRTRNYGIDRLNGLASAAEFVARKATENTAYGRFVEKMEALIAQAPETIKTKLNTFLHFDVEGQNAERILKGLSRIQYLIPNEYNDLTEGARQIMQDEKNYDTGAKVSGSMMMYGDRMDHSDEGENKEEIIPEELSSGNEPTPEPPPVVAQKIKSNPNVIMSDRPAVRIDTPLSFEDIKKMRQENPVLTIREERKSEPVAGETPAEKFLREMAQSNEAKISNTEIATKIDRYVDEATYAIPLKELRKRLALAPAEDMAEIITNSPELTEEQRNELLTILGVQVAIPGDLPYPDGYVPEPPPVVGQEPIPVEDPATRVRSLNERMSEAVVVAQPVEMSQGAVELLSTTRHKEPIGPLNKPPEQNLNEQRSAVAKPKNKTIEEQIREGKGRLERNKQTPTQIIEATTPTPKQQGVESLVFGPMTKEQAEIDEFLRDKVAEAREEFAMYEVEYKKKIWDGKKKYQKLMSGLGVPEKQRPSIEKEQFHREAEEAYMEAKWNLKNFMAGRDVQKFKGNKMVFGEATSGARLVDVGLMDQAENEFRFLQKQIIETSPLEEKGRVKKALEVLARVPTYQKVILGSAFTALAIGIVGGGGVTAAFAMFGKRIIKSTAGVSGALGTGKWIDGVKRKVDKEARADRFADYGEKVGATREDFEKEEKENEQFFKDQEMYDKRIRLAKAATMAVVGGLSAATAGVVEGAVTDAFTTPGVKVNPDLNIKPKGGIPEGTQPKGSFLDKFVKKQSPFEPTPAPKVVVPEKIIETHVEAKYTTPVEINLSSKGFIDTVDQLKKATSGQKLTPALEKLLTQSPQKIAMDLGLYKPGQAAESAFGYQGEQLAIDAEGNVSLVHNSGATEVLMDSKGTLKPFAGEMFDADKTATSPYPADAPIVASAEGSDAAFNGPEPLEKSGEVEVGAAVSDRYIGDSAWNNMFRDAEPGSVGIKLADTNPADLISGKVAIKPELQFDDSFKEYRRAYNIALERKLMDAPKDLFDYKLPVEYKGGRIYIFQNGKTLTALLNGEKIATGSVVDGKIGLQYESRLGTGLFGAKTEFEQAFKVAQEAIEKNKKAFNVANT